MDGTSVVHTTSQGQRTLAKSSCDAEYNAGSYAGNGVVFTTNLIEEMMGEDAMDKPGDFIGDNQGALFLMNNMQVGQRTKHIDIKAHWLRQIFRDNITRTRFTRSKDMVVDIDTKNVDEKTFKKHATYKRYGPKPVK